MKFGEYLAEQNLIKSSHLKEALRTQRYQKKPIGRILVDLGYLSEPDLNKQLQKYLPVDTLSEVSDLELPALPEDIKEWAKIKKVFIKSFSEKQIEIVTTEFSDSLIAEVKEKFNRNCRIFVANSDTLSALGKILGEDLDTSHGIVVKIKETDDQKIQHINPYTMIFRDSLEEAQARGASDIHIQPEKYGIKIHLRVNGDLVCFKSFDLKYKEPITAKFKKLCNLNVARSGLPQDSRISFKEWKLDVRVNLLPTIYGDKIVLRLLDLKQSFELKAIGFSDSILADLQDSISHKNGIVIVSGPTGSGKTTTLYSLLSALNNGKRNIITLEDPVEYSREGLTQVQVSKKMGFASALRSVLRQDPDVILLGEIRDSETANIAIQAASTGHLVLSTLHANSALGVVDRLMDLGIEPFLIKSNLRMAAAQRLVKQLCPSCSNFPKPESVHDLYEQFVEHKISKVDASTFRILNKDGCESCTSGAVGRVPLLEYVTQDEVSRYLNSRDEQLHGPSHSLAHAALIRAQQGEVDLYEFKCS